MLRRSPNSPSQSSDFAELRRCDDETRHWIMLHIAGYEMRVPDVKASKRHFKKDPVIRIWHFRVRWDRVTASITLTLAESGCADFNDETMTLVSITA